MQKFWLFLYKYSARKLATKAHPAHRPSVNELNAILHSNKEREIVVMPDGSIIAV